MRRGMEWIVGVSLACGLLTFAPQPSRAVGVEKSLLGVRILQTYRDVLKLYGAPTRIYRANEVVHFQEGRDASGDMTGSVLSLGEGSSPNMPGSGPSSGGGGGMPEAAGPKSGGGPGSAGGMGSGGGSSDDVSTTFAQAGGYIWAYHYPNFLNPLGGKLYLFLFNAQGRLLLTMERGRAGGGPTSTGVNLGSSLASVYSQYGWPDNVIEEGNGIVLNYTQKHHLAVAVIKGKVVGLGISLFEMPKFRMFALDENGGGAGGGPSSGGGGRGAGGKAGAAGLN